MRRTGLTVVAGVALLVFVKAVVGCAPAMNGGVSASVGGAPVFEVDPFWPKPLPNNWLMGQAAGVAADKRNHVWVVQRPKSLTDDEKGATLTPPRSLCCRPAPPVLEFDQTGALVQSWGGPAAGQPWPENEHGIYVDDEKGATLTPPRSLCCRPAPPVLEFDQTGALVQSWGGPAAGQPWPENEHGIYVDDQDNVWLAGNGPKDGMILKFTASGKLLLKIGEPGIIGDDKDTTHLNRPANMVVDPATRELIVADGYGNHRVIVFDADTGAYKRHWGANGRPPGDASVKGFANPVHCVRLSRDGLLYVCDRMNNRIQVFRKDGTFVREFMVAPETKGNGSTWDLDLSTDAPQTHLYTADGENNQVWMLLRESGQILGSFGRNGRSAGQFHWVHNMAVDSMGNIYTTEVDTGKRAQKFVLKTR